MNGEIKPDDIQCVKGLQSGSVQAFDLLFQRYSNRLYSYSLSLLKTHQDAEEIVQITFEKIWEKREEITSDRSFKSFLFTIAYHLIIDQFRKNLQSRKYEDFILHEARKNFNVVEEELEYNELHDKIEKAISNLPERRRIIFKMSRIEGLSHKEIAERLDISPETVENHINLAICSLKKVLERDSIAILLFVGLFL